MSDTRLQEIEKPQKKAKEINIIRKTTQETLEPIITKIEEHIEYLLAETTKMRLKSQTLEKTVANHEILEQSIKQNSDEINEVKLSAMKINTEQSKENQSSRKQFVNLGVEIEEIRIDLKRKENRISELFEKNAEQSVVIEQNKTQFTEMVSKYSETVEELMTQNRRLSSQMRMNSQLTSSKMQALGQRIKDKEDAYYETEQKVMLYLEQREQIRQMISHVTEKIDKTIEIDRYEKDWRIIRMENQEMRRENRKMIDEALTPEVRTFLPEMMERMAEIRKVNSLQIFFYDQKAKTDAVEQQHLKTMQSLALQIEEAKNYVDELDKKRVEASAIKYKELFEKMEKGASSQSEVVVSLETQTKELIRKTEESLKTEISELIDKNKDYIYDFVYEKVPQEEKDFFEKMKEFIPLLEKTKVQLMSRCDDITAFGETLQGRLDDFHNRMVKIRSDTTLRMDTLNKKNKIFEDSFMEVKRDFAELGKIISMYCEYLMISYSINFEPLDNEVFVTYTDGIIYEKNPADEPELFYRKTKAHRQVLLRSTLSTMMKLTDQLITSEQFSFLKISKHKPSDYFKIIKEGLILTSLGKSTPRKESQLPHRQRSKRKKEREGKLPSLELNSKTIDVTEQQESNIRSELLSQTLASNDFKNSFRKKSERPYVGRYSQMN